MSLVLFIVNTSNFYYYISLFIIFNILFYIFAKEAFYIFVKDFFYNYLRLLSLFIVFCIFLFRLSYIYFNVNESFTLLTGFKLIFYAITFSFIFRFLYVYIILIYLNKITEFFFNITFIRQFIEIKNELLTFLNNGFIFYFIDFIIVSNSIQKFFDFCKKYLLMLDKYYSFLSKKNIFFITRIEFFYQLIFFCFTMLYLNNYIDIFGFFFYYYLINQFLFN